MRRNLALAALLALTITGGLLLLFSLLRNGPDHSGTDRKELGKQEPPGGKKSGVEVNTGQEKSRSGKTETKVADVSRDLFISGKAICMEGDREFPLATSEIHVQIQQGGRASSITCITGPAGQFRLKGLVPGDGVLTFSHGDFSPVKVDVHLVQGEPITGLVVTFEPRFLVWGRVLDLAGRPVPDAILEFYSLDGTKQAELKTDSRGMYRTSALQPVLYRVRVVPRILREAWGDAPKMQVILLEDDSGRRDFQVDLGDSLDILVTDRKGGGLPGIRVHFQLKTSGGEVSGVLAKTDNKGKTVLSGLPAGGTLVLRIVGEGGEGGSKEVDLESLPPLVRLQAGS